jgi:polar amino acid transport system ATP-binding protein
VLACEGVVKRFGKQTVLRSVDLEVAEHQVVTLIGASGSGKSSLLRCINLLETVDDGVIRLDGEDITDPRVDADGVRRRIGVVFQAYNLFPHMSVLDNVTLAPRLVGRLDKAAAAEPGRALLDRVGLAEKAGEYPDRLSGGSSSGSRSRGRWPTSRGCCCSTRSPRRSTRARRRGPGAHPRAQGAGHDHRHGHPRDELRPAGRGPGGVPRRRRRLEEGPPEQVLAEPASPRTRQFLARILDAGHR